MTALRTLQAYARRPAPARVEERCELCAAALPEAHRHLVDLEQRALRCACQACALLMLQPGAARRRYRAVPDRVLADPGFVLDEARWSALQIPVRLAFMLFNSRLARWVAIYPSPAGPTEAELPEAWMAMAKESALIAAVEPDVEALVCWGPRGQDRFEAYLAPVDVGYQLVARVRQTWRGFDGGDDLRRAVSDLFVRLRVRSRTLRVTP